MSARSLHHLCRLAALSLFLAPLAAHADVGISVGYTGEHDSQRGQVYNLDWVPEGYSWDLTAGAIRGTETRDTSWVAAAYQIVDQHLYASFGPALIRHQTTTLTSQRTYILDKRTLMAQNLP